MRDARRTNDGRRGARGLRGTVLTVAAGLLVAGCGGGYYEEGYYPYPDGGGYPPVVYYGTVQVDNLTDTTTFEDVNTFFLGPAGTGTFSGNLLPVPLAPGFIADLGDFVEDFYDAEADLQLGDLVTWFDVAVPAAQVTTFEVF